MVPTKDSYTYNLIFRTTAAIVIKVVSIYSGDALLHEATFNTTSRQTAELPSLSQKQNDVKKIVDYKVVEHHRFSTESHLMDINPLWSMPPQWRHSQVVEEVGVFCFGLDPHQPAYPNGWAVGGGLK
ncbi:hypothetical protein AVEN_145878-1 [Araneus ventricosus]|uniref:Uncharacterized protein n=1 Tax=Araneus ventricosus TaxID=182803 RepID=A0A4Y2IHQ2_ARAVE|nr:hypothetical protein AVEN_145878-1 [Araneus ventricosus]